MSITRDLKNCTIKFKAGGSDELEINIGEGDISWSEKRDVKFELNRGLLDNVRLGDQIPMDVNIDISYVNVKASSADSDPTPVEFLKKIGLAVDFDSSDSDACQPYAVDIEVTDVEACDSVDDEIQVFPNFRFEKLSFDMKAATIKCSGKCNATGPTVSRSA